MVDHSKLSRSLRENILAILAGADSPRHLNELVAVCHALARSFLSSKSQTLTLSSAHGLNLSDLAYDCIADLFHRDQDETYIQLRAYFSGLPLTTARDEEILSHVRRLVFSKVNQGIYRLCSEVDPSLAKILRNIKLAIQSLRNFTEVERFGEACIVPSLCPTLEHLPPFEHEDLQQLLLEVTTGRELIPELLATLSLIVREQTDRCRILPLVAVGVVFRAVFEKKELERPESVQPVDSFEESDSRAIIAAACHKVGCETQEKYVSRGKVSDQIFRSYFVAIEEGLYEKYLGRDGHDSSLCEILIKHIPELTKDEYMKLHRNRVEYLLKLVQKEIARQI